jgi:hypothetical protein
LEGREESEVVEQLEEKSQNNKGFPEYAFFEVHHDFKWVLVFFIELFFRSEGEVLQ